LYFIVSFCCEGHAKIIDKFLSDTGAMHHDTVAKDKITMQDPDWLVKQCYLLIIASAIEIVNGMENLWKSEPFVGHHNYPHAD
jgi:hypothetical protein